MDARRCLLILLAVALWTAVPSSMQPPPQPTAGGRLLVIVVVDQMRFDYLDRFKGLFKDGIARLLRDGAVFERANYPYLNTVTCAGHATIGTGAFPSTHGIIMNEWWQRAERRRLSCTNDPSVTPLPYNGAREPIGHSAYRLRIPSFGDRLRARWPDSRVVTLSMKPRSTVMLAGHGGTAVTWLSDANSWGTSTAYATEPVPAVQAYVDANPLERYRAEVWNPVNDVASYVGPDDGVGERGPSGWTPLFPHPLAGRPGTRPERFFELWERSPYSDAVLGDMAAHLVRALQLGQRGVVDYLGVSFSALDYVGHDFGPNSIEVQDTLIRLDRTLGALLTALDSTVGADSYTIGLSADHGVAPIPESLVARGQDAGRVINGEVQKVAEAAMTAAHGPGPHVAQVEYSELYLTDKTRALVDANPAALQPLVDAVGAMKGVMRVLRSKGLEKRKTSRDPVERAAALGYFPGESGDVQVVLKPNWIGTASSAATHGTLHPYDQHVPVIFFGPQIRPGRYREPASPADVAPTLASLVQLAMPGVDGKVLRRAVR